MLQSLRSVELQLERAGAQIKVAAKHRTDPWCLPASRVGDCPRKTFLGFRRQQLAFAGRLLSRSAGSVVPAFVTDLGGVQTFFRPRVAHAQRRRPSSALHRRVATSDAALGWLRVDCVGMRAANALVIRMFFMRCSLAALAQQGFVPWRFQRVNDFPWLLARDIQTRLLKTTRRARSLFLTRKGFPRAQIKDALRLMENPSFSWSKWSRLTRSRT